MILYITLALCALLAGLLVYRYDMYDREPWYMIVLTIVIGAGAMWGIGYIEDATMHSLQDAAWTREVSSHVLLSLIAATHEELARLLIVAGLAIFASRKFDDPLDGIIYGSVAGLGMAVQESIQFLSLSETRGALPATELLRLLGHLVMGGITGFGVGMARMRIRRWGRNLLGCLIVSTALHFFWDWIALSSRDTSSMEWWQKGAAMVLMLWGCVFYGVLVIVASDWSRKHFAPHKKSALWGWPFSLWKTQSRE